MGNRLEKREDLGNNGTIDKVTQGLFDQNDRLINETEIANGQSVKRTDYVYNKTEQIAKTITNLLNSKVESQTSLKYNAQGRLSKISIDTFTNGIKTEAVTQEYSYDSSGIKIKQVEKIDANADGLIDSQSDTSYLNEALNHTGYAQVLEERRLENGQVVKTTTYTIGHDVLSQFNSVNGYLALMADGHGSTRGVANSLGQVVQEYSYDAYGNAIGFVPKNALTNLLYSGEQFNPVSGLQYLRARWYNPENGRFNRLDPYFGNHENPLSFHKYAYAHMNPVRNIDPSGLFSLAGFVTAMKIGVGIGSAAGLLGGVALSYYKGNPILSWATAEHAIYGLLGGALAGALMSGFIYLGPKSVIKSFKYSYSQLLTKLKGVHTLSTNACVSGFLTGFLVGLLDKDYKYGNLADIGFVGTAVTNLTAGTVVSQRTAIVKIFGEKYGPKITIIASRYVRATAFVGLYFMAGFTVGYKIGHLSEYAISNAIYYLVERDLE